MARVIDKTTGTGANPYYFPFAGRVKALSFVALVDDDRELDEGFLTGAQAMLRGTLQRAGFNVADARFCCALDSGGDANALVALSVNVARDVSDEAGA